MYIIPFKGLAVGRHSFEWNVDKSFFAAYESSEIDDANIHVHVNMIKHVHFLELDFVLDGWAEVKCDRCLDPLKIEINIQTDLYVAFDKEGNNEEVEERDVVFLSHDEDQLDVTQYIYEYAHLSLPVRRVHPDDKNGRSTCNEEMIKRLSQYLVE